VGRGPSEAGEGRREPPLSFKHKRKSPNRTCLGLLRGPPGDPPHTRCRQMSKISEVSKKGTEAELKGDRDRRRESEVKQPDAGANRKSSGQGSQSEGQPRLAKCDANRVPDFDDRLHVSLSTGNQKVLRSLAGTRGAPAGDWAGASLTSVSCAAPESCARFTVSSLRSVYAAYARPRSTGVHLRLHYD
jgi:hypothetical protein